MTNRARSATTITARREIRSATTPPISSVATIGSVRTASTMPTSVADPPNLEHRERQRDAHHPVADDRDGLRAEQQPELAQPQDPHPG